MIYYNLLPATLSSQHYDNCNNQGRDVAALILVIALKMTEIQALILMNVPWKKMETCRLQNAMINYSPCYKMN